jgi:hypothetical protein
VTGAVGHGGIAVAGKTVSLRAKSDGRECDGENGNADSEDFVANSQSCSFPCGVIHPAVFFPQEKEDFSILSWFTCMASDTQVRCG